jgi:hypothetical protein
MQGKKRREYDSIIMSGVLKRDCQGILYPLYEGSKIPTMDNVK